MYWLHYDISQPHHGEGNLIMIYMDTDFFNSRKPQTGSVIGSKDLQEKYNSYDFCDFEI